MGKNSSNNSENSPSRLILLLTVINVAAAVISGWGAISSSNNSDQANDILRQQTELIEKSTSPQILVRDIGTMNRGGTICTLFGLTQYRRDGLAVIEVLNNGGAPTSLVTVSTEYMPDDNLLSQINVYLSPLDESQYNDLAKKLGGGASSSLTFGTPPIPISPGSAYYIPFETHTRFIFNPNDTDQINFKWSGKDVVTVRLEFTNNIVIEKTIELFWEEIQPVSGTPPPCPTS